MRKDRVGNLMEVELEYKGSKVKEDVWIPFEIYVEAIRRHCGSKLVGLDGTDNAIWNMFVDLGCVDNFADDGGFLNICRELYKGSKYEEDDLAEYEGYME